MNQSIRTNLLFLALAVIATIIIYSCGEDTVTNNNNNTPFNCFNDTNTPGTGVIRGQLTFFDTNQVYGPGYYDISAYASWPPAGPPSSSDTIDLYKNNGIYSGCYQITGLTSGASYVLVAAYIDSPYVPSNHPVHVLSVRGCDTNRSCFFVSPKRDTLPATQGLKNINFNGALDTTGRVRF